MTVPDTCFSWFSLLALVVVALPAWATTPPSALHFSGHLDTGSVEFTGQKDITFRLYGDDTTPTVLWEELHTGVAVKAGRFHVLLGGNGGNPLPDSVYGYPDLHVGLTLENGTEMTPRLRVSSVPFARLAQTSQTLQGSVPANFVASDQACSPGSFVASVTDTGALVCAAVTQWDTLSGLSCSNGYIPQYNNGAWTCDAPTDNDTLGALNCGLNKMIIYTSVGWGCTNESDPSVGMGTTDRLARWNGSQLVDSTVVDTGGAVGIGVDQPSVPLHIAGKIRIVDGSQGEGRVLTSNAAGTATWMEPSGGGSTGTTIQGRPFIGRSVSLSNHYTGYQTVQLTPLKTGNHLTVTHIKVEGYTTNNSFDAYIQYVFHYADETSYQSAEYTTKSGSYTELYEANIPINANLRGTITSIDLKVRSTHSSSSVTGYGRLTVSGHETGPEGLSAGKPFVGRSVSLSNHYTGYQSVELTTLQAGNHLTPTQIKVEGYTTNNSFDAYIQYVFHYADGTTYYSSEYTTKSGSYTELFDANIPIHDNLTGSIAKLELRVRSTHSSSSVTGYGRLTVSGYESTP